MQASQDELNALLEAQKLDLEIINLNKQFAELPQPATVSRLRAKKNELTKKREQIEKLYKDASKRKVRTDDEDASLEKKQNGVQAAIEAAAGDYRNVEARTKELAGISKRRETLAAEKEQIAAELAKIVSLSEQIDDALTDLDKKEEASISDYRKQGGAIKGELAELSSKRDKLLARVSADVAKEYRKTSERLGSVAIGKLEGDKCGICRSVISGGRLIDLKSQAPLGVCPSCSRLLVIASE